MKLYFIRHAEAEAHCEDDRGRALSAKGREQTDRVASFLKKANILDALILSSPFKRAKQTATILSKRVGNAGPEIVDWLGCGMAPETCMSQLSQTKAGERPIILVGHEPDFSETIAAWIGASTGDLLHIRKASVTHLDISAFTIEGARLEFLVPARLM